MSVTKDGDTGRWMSQIRVTDWTGNTIHKKKRGFATKKEALQWERDFISQSTGSLGMTFGDFIALYVKDMEHRLKPSTVASKKWLIDLKVTPFFKKIPLNEIKPTHVRQWQNSLTSYRDENGKPYAQTYLKCINNQLTAIFNYAVKYYGLKENPCHKAGSMGKKKADEMLFWTKDEFQTFIESHTALRARYFFFNSIFAFFYKFSTAYRTKAKSILSNVSTLQAFEFIIACSLFIYCITLSALKLTYHFRDYFKPFFFIPSYYHKFIFFT